MKYTSNNEFKTFDFSQSVMGKVSVSENKVVFTATDVIIKETNSHNREIFNMGTDELTMSFLNVSELSIIKDGYRLYDANNNLLESHDDEVIAKENYKDITSAMEGFYFGEISKDGNEYIVSVDIEDKLSYTIICKAESDREEWDIFRKIPNELRG